MALDFNPQERGMFAAPRMPNATWGGLVQGYQTMQSPLQAIGAGLDRSARISNQNKLTDLIGSGRMDLNDPMKATQQALPMLNRTTESAVQNFGNLLNRSLQARQERRADAAQALNEKRAQWNREETLANLGFRNLEAQNAQDRLRMDQEMNPLRKALLGEQIKSQQFNRDLQRRRLEAEQAQQAKDAMQIGAYVDDDNNVHYVTKGEAMLKGYAPFDVTQKVRRANRESPKNRAMMERGINFLGSSDAELRNFIEQALTDRNTIEDVDIGTNELAEIRSILTAMDEEKLAEIAMLPPEERLKEILKYGGIKPIDRPLFYRYLPWGSDIQFINEKIKEEDYKDNRSFVRKLFDLWD